MKEKDIEINKHAHDIFNIKDNLIESFPPPSTHPHTPTHMNMNMSTNILENLISQMTACCLINEASLEFVAAVA